jgi:broad specificity phosphatase PhoE
MLALVTLVSPPEAHAQGPTGAPESDLSVIYLVRHAERATDHPRDPTLSAEGTDRAAELARLLADAPLARIFSTGYRRTLATAAPVAESHGITVELYEADRDGLAATADLLARTPGHHLVVGHSNTTPALVALLGGEPQGAIAEMEYDRLYLVAVAPGGEVTSTLLRFGDAFRDGGG